VLACVGVREGGSCSFLAMRISIVINLGEGWVLWRMLASVCLGGKGGAGAVGQGENDHLACIWLLSEGFVGVCNLDPGRFIGTRPKMLLGEAVTGDCWG